MLGREYLMSQPNDEVRDTTGGDASELEHDVNRRLATVWRDSRLGPTVEKLRRHVLRDGDSRIELSQYRLLHALAEQGAMPMLSLAKAVGATQSSVSRTVQRLEERALVERTRSEMDLRSFTVSLTPQGAVIHKYLVARAYDVYTDIFAVFTVDEREGLATMLERLLKSADATLADTDSVPGRD